MIIKFIDCVWPCSLPPHLSFTEPPDPVRNLSLAGSASESKVNLTWREPVFDGYNAITHYTARCISEGWDGRRHEVHENSTGTLRYAKLTGLKSGQSYSCFVAAVNRVGPSMEKEIVVVTRRLRKFHSTVGNIKFSYDVSINLDTLLHIGKLNPFP